MKGNAANKRADRYIIATIIIVILTIFSMGIYGYYNAPTLFTHFERIEIKSTAVTKSAYIYNIVDIYSYNKVDVYFVIINFANTGNSQAMIESVLLNGVPYNDPNWTGTFKPVVFGDLTPKFQFIDADASYVGILEFSEDCKDPSGNKLMAGGDDHYYVNMTIHTYGGKDYEASIILQQNLIQEVSLSPVFIFSIVIVTAVASVALLILIKRRLRPSPSPVGGVDKVAKWYVIAAVISVVTLVRGPEIIIAVLYDTIMVGGPMDIWYLVMHLTGLAFLIITYLVYDISRGKHAYGQPPLQREGYILAAIIIALMIVYTVAITWVIGYCGSPGRYVI